ncbi:CD276 antigen homolog [Hoplias malabaricus]|uniref:CD276 antigen homolog n=1 Tax=Hoplias malabaricus TaxID=27720 RepID=UPI003462A86B
MLWLFFILYISSRTAAFKVTVPTSRLVAVRGQSTVLGCEFTPYSSLDLSTLVVTWQKKKGDQVVHSFYYQRDQLDRQNLNYWNRTSLFNTELKKGNASLRIEAVGPYDVGEYVCLVSNSQGTDKAQVQLEYGAFYTEPRLSIWISGSNVTLQYVAEGFPKPEVLWLDDQGQNLNHNTEVIEGPNGALGLYYVRSSYVTQDPTVNATFILMNKLLNQHLQRPVNLIYGENNTRCGASRLAVFLSIMCCLLFVSMVILLLKLPKNHCKATQRGQVS